MTPRPFAILIPAVLALSACASDPASTGTAAGAAVGSVFGAATAAAFGGDREEIILGTAIGAGIGAAVGQSQGQSSGQCIYSNGNGTTYRAPCR